MHAIIYISHIWSNFGWMWHSVNEIKKDGEKKERKKPLQIKIFDLEGDTNGTESL